MNTPRFIPLGSCDRYFDITKKDIQNLFYVDRKNARNDRFIVQDGELKVHPNYKCPHFDTISELYYEAVSVASSEKDVAKFISRRTGKSENTIYFYFRNFKFKNPDFARIVIKLLKIFIKQNSLFVDEILEKE